MTERGYAFMLIPSGWAVLLLIPFCHSHVAEVLQQLPLRNIRLLNTVLEDKGAAVDVCFSRGSCKMLCVVRLRFMALCRRGWPRGVAANTELM